MTSAGSQTSKSQDRARMKSEDERRKAERTVTRYRVDFTELPEGQEPNWDALIAPVLVEKYVYGAGWQEVLPIRPVMAAEMRDRSLPPTEDSRIRLAGPIWPPREA